MLSSQQVSQCYFSSIYFLAKTVVVLPAIEALCIVPCVTHLYNRNGRQQEVKLTLLVVLTAGYAFTKAVVACCTRAIRLKRDWFCNMDCFSRFINLNVIGSNCSWEIFIDV